MQLLEENCFKYMTKTKIKKHKKYSGSPITWNIVDQPNIYILLGLLNGKVTIGDGKHIWVSDKGDYYEICDKWPQYKIYP